MGKEVDDFSTDTVCYSIQRLSMDSPSDSPAVCVWGGGVYIPCPGTPNVVGCLANYSPTGMSLNQAKVPSRVWPFIT